MTNYHKILIVIIVLAVIMAGIYLYLFVLDRKIRKIEKQLKGKEHSE